MKMLEDRARTRRLESEELERRFDVLEEQLHRMDVKIEERELTITKLRTLGAKGNLPSGYIVSLLWVLKQFAQLIPSR